MTELPAEPTPEEETTPPAASLVITFAPGTLDISIATGGIVTQSHLWAASALLERIADQLWVDRQAAIRMAEAQQRAATQQVLRDLKLPGRRS